MRREEDLMRVMRPHPCPQEAREIIAELIEDGVIESVPGGFRLASAFHEEYGRALAEIDPDLTEDRSRPARHRERV